MRWRERARKDLKKFGIEEGSCYKVAQERGSWREGCRVVLEDATEKRMQEHEMRKRRKAAGLSRTLPDTDVLPLARKVK